MDITGLSFAFYRSLDCVLIDLFMGGSETTSITLIWTFLFLLHHPEVQTKLHIELDAECGHRLAELSDMENLHMVKAVMHESLRVSCVVPCGVPHYVQEDTRIGGYFFPAGVNVMANLGYILHDPTVWENPQTFQPERFLNSEGKFENAFAKHFVPFSVGKRFCLGQTLSEQEYFLFLTGILKRFTLSRDESQTLPSYKFEDDYTNRGFIRYAPKYKVHLNDRK